MEQDDNTGLVLGVVFGVLVLVIGLVFGVVLHHQSGRAKAQPVAAATAAGAGADGASVRVDSDGVVRFYFAPGKADLADGTPAALATVATAVQGGRRVQVSGFHDDTGDAAANAELAKQRAFAVRDALQALGVAADRIELRKPEQMLGSGSRAEARRVEVRAVD